MIDKSTDLQNTIPPAITYSECYRLPFINRILNFKYKIMKITVTEDLGIQLEEVFSGLTLKTESGETISICMRDTGFEFNYQGEWYFAKEGYVEPFHKSIRDNYLVEQKHDGSIDCLPQSNSEQS